MLTKTEINYLKSLKRFNGHSEEQIEEELINLISSDNLFKNLKKDYDKLKNKLKKMEQQEKELKDELIRKNKDIFNLKHQVNLDLFERKTRGKSVSSANVHQLKRILCILKEEGPMAKSKIYHACGMISEQGNSAITFLGNHNLIKQERGLYQCL